MIFVGVAGALCVMGVALTPDTYKGMKLVFGVLAAVLFAILILSQLGGGGCGSDWDGHTNPFSCF